MKLYAVVVKAVYADEKYCAVVWERLTSAQALVDHLRAKGLKARIEVVDSFFPKGMPENPILRDMVESYVRGDHINDKG